MIDKQRLRTFLLGGAIGALAGVLLAPRSGRELRSNLANRAGEAHERSRETYFEAQERLQERLSEAREGPSAIPEVEREPEVSFRAEAPREVTETFTERPRLREVSDGAYEGETTAERPDELRRKVQETRARLRKRLDGTEPPGEREQQDE